MTPTTFQTARRERKPTYCPCGQPAIKRDGASYVCAKCLERDQVAHELTKEMESQYVKSRLTAAEYYASLEKVKVKAWFSRREKRVAS